MGKIMYEVLSHYIYSGKSKQGVFSHCTVSPITVHREGVLPGHNRVSISGIDCQGREFFGYRENFYHSEDEARSAITESACGLDKTGAASHPGVTLRSD